MLLPFADLKTGLEIWSPDRVVTLYQSIDCTGQAYFPVNLDADPSPGPLAIGIATAIPPATAPSIYFAGKPTSALTMKSSQQAGNCYPAPTGFASYAGPIQNILVSSLGLALPFTLK